MHLHRIIVYGSNVIFLYYVPNEKRIKSNLAAQYVFKKYLKRILSEYLAKSLLINTLGEGM